MTLCKWVQNDPLVFYENSQFHFFDSVICMIIMISFFALNPSWVTWKLFVLALSVTSTSPSNQRPLSVLFWHEYTSLIFFLSVL